jgi:hypothetical protein
MTFTLPMITKALLAATPEEVAEWIAACQEVAPMPLKKGKKSKKSKKSDEDTPRPPKTPPKQDWNNFRQQFWHEMAAEVGVFYADFMKDVDESDEKAVEKAKKLFGKAAAEAGAGYQMAFKGAGAAWEKKKEEGGVEKKPVKKSSKKETPPPTPQPEATEETEEAEVSKIQQSFAAKQGMTLQIFEGAAFLVSPRVAGKKGSEAFFMGDDNQSVGERAGKYMWDTEEVDYTE